MRELSLFSGAGGGLLGTKLLGWQAVGYVERDPYCQAVLEARIRDGLLDPAPIFGDIRAFLRSGDCDRFAGRVDVVTAGVPCQIHSRAARGRERGDDLWPETIETIRRVSPGAVLIENVRGVRRALPAWISDLRGAFYTVERPIVVTAAEVGAGHIRERVWILAHRDGEQLRLEQGRWRRQGWANPQEPLVAAWWASEPGVARVVRRVAAGMDRRRAIGNIQVPAVVALAWRTLIHRARETRRET